VTHDFVVGPDYVHRLAGSCQSFVGAVCVAEPDVFQSAVHALTAHLPPAETSANLVFTWALLALVTTRGALTYHAQFHRCFGGACEFQPPSTPPLDASECSVMRQRIDKWAEVYQVNFDRTHQWPAATTAAAALRRRAPSAWYASDLARTVGASCSTLERGFKAIYRTTPGHYHALVRLRHTVEAVRADSGSLEGMAMEAGWSSVNAFARVFRTMTGTTPSIVRQLGDEDFVALIDGPLALPIPQPRHAGVLRPDDTN
jgi:AraC-like DNA-binding protein